MVQFLRRFFLKGLVAWSVLVFCAASLPLPRHGFSPFGQLSFPETAAFFPYVNPNAPQGGTLVLGALGGFDSLNPYIVLGNAAGGMAPLITAQLLDDCYAAPGEAYVYGAQTIDVAPDGLSVVFTLREGLTFSNGEPITVEDVLWTFETLKTKGLPNYRTYYKNVVAAEKVGKQQIKFTFSNAHNKELPLILGQLPLLSRSFYAQHPFEKGGLAIPPSSGPYVVETVDPGRSITFKRVPNWWGNTVPSQKGLYNFERIRIEYYMDSNALFEAFKSGKIHLRFEATLKNWVGGYDFPAVHKGDVVREEWPLALSSGTYGLFFNKRRPLFQSRALRKALCLAFDFHWLNQSVFFGKYKRNHSFYPNSDFAAEGLPSPDELALLEPFRNQLPPEVFTTPFTLPLYDTSEKLRQGLKEISSQLAADGWVLEGGWLVHHQTRQPLVFEVLLYDKSHEKILLGYAETLKKLGVRVKIRTIDTASYQERLERHDFDMVLGIVPQSSSLGNEQRDFFGSERADMVGTFNYAGIKNPVVDALIERLIAASSYADLVTCARALDRVLSYDYAIIPAWHSNVVRVAYWKKIAHPEIMPRYVPQYYLNWWAVPESTPLASESTQEVVPEQDVSWWRRLFSRIF